MKCRCNPHVRGTCDACWNSFKAANPLILWRLPVREYLPEPPESEVDRLKQQLMRSRLTIAEMRSNNFDNNQEFGRKLKSAHAVLRFMPEVIPALEATKVNVSLAADVRKAYSEMEQWP